MQPVLRSLPSLLVSLVVALGVGFISSVVTRPAIEGWYATLSKPPLNPPNFVFAPVWTLLFIMMAVAAWLVWRAGRREARRQLALYGIQLALNAGWSLVFFGLISPGWALVEVVFLLAAIAATAYGFGRWSVWAQRLLWPYLAWVAFAAYLTLGIWWLN